MRLILPNQIVKFVRKLSPPVFFFFILSVYPEGDVLDEPYSAKPAQQSIAIHRPARIHRRMDTVPVYPGGPVRQLRLAGLADYKVRLKLPPLYLVYSMARCESERPATTPEWPPLSPGWTGRRRPRHRPPSR